MRDGDRSGGTCAVTFARGGIPVLAGAGVLRGGFPGVPAVLALNLMDIARARSHEIDVPALSARLGIPVEDMHAAD